MIKGLLRGDIDHMPCQFVYDAEILADCLGECEILAGSEPEGIYLRKPYGGCQRTCQDGISRKDGCCADKRTKALPALQDKEHYEIEHHENTYHDGDIVIGKDGRSQCHRIEEPALFIDQLFKSQTYKREEHDAVKPHDIPGICCHITRKGIEYAEECGCKGRVPAVLTEIGRHGQTGKTGL